MFCCAKTILSVMSVKSFVRHHSYMVSSFIFINNFHKPTREKKILPEETLLVNSCFFFIVLRFYGPHFMRAGNKKIKREKEKKKGKRNCSPSSAKTDSRHQQQLAATTNHLGFLHCPSEPTEISFTNLNESFPSHLLTGGCAARLLAIDKQTQTKEMKRKEKHEAKTTSFHFIFIDTLGNVWYTF